VAMKQEKKLYDALVIGGGPAGMFGAILLKESLDRVAIIEKNDRLGKKLLLSGSGQCNLTHSGNMSEFASKYGSKASFLKASLKAFDNNSLLRFFEDRGISFEARKDGKIFPGSGKASDILAVLEKELKKTGVDIICNEKAVSVSKDDNGFKIETKNFVVNSKVLVLATGGMSYPSTGSAGDGYDFAEKLGHTIKELKPALSPIVCNNFKGKGLAGLSFESVGLGLWRKGKKKASYRGALLYTHDGLSGPVILNNSRDFEANDILEVNYIYPVDRALFEKGLMEKASNKLPPRVKTYLKEYSLTERFCLDRMNYADIHDNIKISELSKTQRRKLALWLSQDQFIIKEVKGYNLAMVTCGGVDTNEINRKTMESKKEKGLFFAGEIIDIDGDTGGYNLQAAFSTAWSVANAVKNMVDK